MLGADVVVLKFAGFSAGGVQRLLQRLAQEHVGGTGTLDLVTPVQLLFQIRFQFGHRDAQLLQQFRNEAVGLLRQSQEQVLSIQLLVGATVGELLRLLQSRLRFQGQSVQLHDRSITSTGEASSCRPTAMGLAAEVKRL